MFFWCAVAFALDPGPLSVELAQLPAPDRLVRLGGLLAGATDPAEVEALSVAVEVARAIDPTGPSSVTEALLRAALDPDPQARAWALAQVHAAAVAPIDAVATELVVAEPVDGDVAALESYEERRLFRNNRIATSPLIVPVGTMTYVGSVQTSVMEVLDGNHVRYKTIPLTERLHDDWTATEAVRRTQVWRGSVGGSAALLAVATAAMAGGAVAFDQREQYGGVAALAIGAVVTGSTAITLAPLAFFKSKYERFPSVAYKGRVADLDQLIRAHNDALRVELGLTEEQVARFEQVP